MRKISLFLIVLAFAVAAVAGEPVKCTPLEAAKHVGEFAAVTGRVDGFHESGKGNMFLNMGGRYPNQAFTAFIPAAHAGAFADAKKYVGKTITVTGKIALYRGKPEIILSDASQIAPQ